MISREQALDRLIEACPSFLGAHDLYEYIDWAEDEGSPDPYVRAVAFGQHTIRLVEQGRADELRSMFSTVEQILEHGDDEAIELMRLGYLEYLQNICSHDDVGVSRDSVAVLLGPRAAHEWSELALLWDHAGRRVADGPRVTEDNYLAIDDPNLKLYLRAHRRKLPDGVLASEADVVRYEHFVADATWRSPRASLLALTVGIALALAVAIVLWR